MLEGGKETFAKAKESLLQGGMERRAAEALEPQRRDIVVRLNGIAAKHHSLGLAQIAAAAKTGGPFDKIIETIDKQIAIMRKEEASDIYHKDRGEAGTTKNQNDHEDLGTCLEKMEAELERLQDVEKMMQEDCTVVEGEFDNAKKEHKDRRIYAARKWRPAKCSRSGTTRRP